MNHAFWHARWESQKIGFHQEYFNSLLRLHWDALRPSLSEQVFVPLCGKSLDMLWLRERGHAVLGVELSQLACKAFFAEQAVEPEQVQQPNGQRWFKDGICLHCGDFFALTKEDLSECSLVYDRAALIALPAEMRQRYVAQLIEQLPSGARILLIALEFKGEEGPPFSVSETEVKRLFGAAFKVELLAREELTDERDVGRSEAAYLLTDQRG